MHSSLVFGLGLRQHINRPFKGGPQQKPIAIPLRISSLGTTIKIFAFKMRSPSKAGQGKDWQLSPRIAASF